MKLNNVYRIRDDCSVFLNIHQETEHVNIISIDITKGDKKYSILENYSCELTDPNITVFSKIISGKLHLSISESGIEWNDNLFQIEVDPDHDVRILYANTSQWQTAIEF